MRWISALILRLAGWRTVYAPMPGPKAVVIVFPHTSNWNFPLGLLFKFKHRMPLKWAGKDTLFRWPLRRIFIALGGVPINRRERTGRVSQLLASFARSERSSCALPRKARGQRARTGKPVSIAWHWRPSCRSAWLSSTMAASGSASSAGSRCPATRPPIWHCSAPITPARFRAIPTRPAKSVSRPNAAAANLQ